MSGLHLIPYIIVGKDTLFLMGEGSGGGWECMRTGATKEMPATWFSQPLCWHPDPCASLPFHDHALLAFKLAHTSQRSPSHIWWQLTEVPFEQASALWPFPKVPYFSSLVTLTDHSTIIAYLGVTSNSEYTTIHSLLSKCSEMTSLHFSSVNVTGNTCNSKGKNKGPNVHSNTRWSTQETPHKVNVSAVHLIIHWKTLSLYSYSPQSEIKLSHNNCKFQTVLLDSTVCVLGSVSFQHKPR